VVVESPSCIWDFPDPRTADAGEEIVAVGADLEPGTLLAAYRRGLFPMYAGRMLAWWSPDPRGVIPVDGFHRSRSLRRAIERFEIRIDTAFADVMEGCADPARPHGWIDARFIHAYSRLYDLGHAHSIETWHDGQLVGGLYGVRIGRLFAGESMFHRVTDASKVACWATAALLNLDGATLFDVQWTTPHLRSLGAVDVTREEYLRLVASATMEPVQIFHNPSCSKSRGALEILQERGVDADVVRYLDAPPDRAALERILDAISDEPGALVRTADPKFKAAGLSKSDVQSRDQVIEVLLKHPEVMERPVVFVGDRAVIARPSEKVLELLD
jgi:leucyl/phenylalanyl-tRNA---protein transferase